MKKLIIAGGTGFLGQVLAQHFTRKGWDVVILTRQARCVVPFARTLLWDGETCAAWTREIEGADALVNLCGKSVNCRYHRRNRRRILQSRLKPTRVLGEAIRKAKRPPPVWINAASATVYRHSMNDPMDEANGEIGHGFSVEICKAWEAAFFKPRLPATRRVALRTSMVLGHAANSVYPILYRLAKCGLGGKLGRGDQMVSWIHELDFARAVQFAIEDEEIEGPLNVTAPAPVTNEVFMKTLRQAAGRSWGLDHYRPLLAIAAFLMRTETELTLKSRYVVPTILRQRRFLFRYPFLDEALCDLANPAGDPAEEATLVQLKS